MKHLNPILRAAGALALSGLLLSACGGGAGIEKPKPLTPLPNAAYHLQTLWQTDTGNGAGPGVSGFQPAVANGRVFVANRDGTVVAINLDSGKSIWHTHTGDVLVSGPSTAAGVLLMGTQNGHVIALSAKSGKQLWRDDLSSEVIAAPGVSPQVAVVHTLDGHLVALNIHTGKRRWTAEAAVPRLTMRGTSSPRIVGNTVYAGMDNGKVLALDLATGEQRWQQIVALPSGRSELDRIVDVDANPLIRGNTLYAVSAGDQMVALSLHGGSMHWRHQVASVTGLATDARNIYTTDLNGVVWAISRTTGHAVWQQKALKHRKLSAPALYDGDVLVGGDQGYLHWLSADNGHVIARGQVFSAAIQAKPVVAGDRVIVLGADGQLAAVRFAVGSQ
jgi:outer membrane protein assembly factor BamB